MNVKLAQKAVIAKAALFGLYEKYATRNVFDMDQYHRLEKLIDDIYSEMIGESNTNSYPNPCSEILLGGSGAEYPKEDEWSYKDEQIKLREAGFDAYNCDMVDEFPRWS